jgi:hypothetical protein
MWLDCVGGNDGRGRHVCKHIAAFYPGVLCGPSNLFTCSLVHATSPEGLDWLTTSNMTVAMAIASAYHSERLQPDRVRQQSAFGR